MCTLVRVNGNEEERVEKVGLELFEKRTKNILQLVRMLFFLAFFFCFKLILNRIIQPIFRNELFNKCYISYLYILCQLYV